MDFRVKDMADGVVIIIMVEAVLVGVRGRCRWRRTSIFMCKQHVV